MSEHVKALFDEARKLTSREREELAELLLDSLPPDPTIEIAWTEEARRRWDEHVASGAATVDALGAVDDVRRQLRRCGGT